MKKFLMIACIGLCAIQLCAQKTTVRYCEVQSYALGFSKMMHATIAFGAGENEFTDSAKTSAYVRHLHKIRSNTEILNYMAANGWSFAGSAIVKDVEITFFFYFKKEYKTD